MSQEWAVEVNNLCYSFGGAWALQELSLQVPVGQVFALLGGNGAGKTTTIRLLTGQLRPQGGQVSVFGLDPEKQAQQVRALVGIMTEEPGHYQRLSARANLRFFASLYGAGAAEADGLLERVGLAEKANCAVSQLSRGMKQRLALARAMVGKPKLLFLDEPTSGLDPLVARGVRELIGQFCREGGTVFLTTHYMEEAENLCHQVAILQAGQLLCCGHYLDLCRQYLPETVERQKGGRTVRQAPGLEELFCKLTQGDLTKIKDI